MTLNIFIINIKSQVNQVDSKCRTELGVKLVCHSKWPIQNALKYNHYVVNGSLFRTLAYDEGKKTQKVECAYQLLMATHIMGS
jgi:isopentenyldiphosphate isomerase